MSLLKSFFPELDEAAQAQLLTRLLDTMARRRVVETKGLQEVLLELKGSEDGKMFDGLREQLEDEKREQLVMRRLGGTRAGVEMKTPGPIKALRPPVQGALVVFQISASAFQGYYPRTLTEEQRNNPRVKKTWSCSRTFGVDRSQEQALKMTVRFIWQKHKEVGGDMSNKPTEQQIIHALERSRKILAGEEADDSDSDHGGGPGVGSDAKEAKAKETEADISPSQHTVNTDGDFDSDLLPSPTVTSSSSSSSSSESQKPDKGGSSAKKSKPSKADSPKKKSKSSKGDSPKKKPKSKAGSPKKKAGKSKADVVPKKKAKAKATSASSKPAATKPKAKGEPKAKPKGGKSKTFADTSESSSKPKLIYDETTGYGSSSVKTPSYLARGTEPDRLGPTATKKARTK